jgi:hypothetical protein
MAKLSQLINRTLVFGKPRTANKGKASPGKPSGFATRDQKRGDIRSALGLSNG